MSVTSAPRRLAHVNDEDYQKDLRPEMGVATQTRLEPSLLSQAEAVLPGKTTEQVRERNLVVVPALPVSPVTTPAPSPIAAQKDAPLTTQPPPQRIIHKVLDDELMAKLDAQLLPEPTPVPDAYDDRAPIFKRITSGIIDLFVVGFASSPFAAIIELTNGNWADVRVAASMGGIVLAVMFLYLTGSVALAGRTWGMSLVSLRAVDVNTGLAPTTRQAVGRAITYMLSLAALGLGLFYALVDAEGRAAHDLFSGTAVVDE